MQNLFETLFLMLLKGVALQKKLEFLQVKVWYHLVFPLGDSFVRVIETRDTNSDCAL